MHCSTLQSPLSSSFQMPQRAFERGRDAHISDVGAMTIIDGDIRTRLEFDVPGYCSDDITIDVEAGQLVVSGELSISESSGPPAYSERRARKFRRVVRLDNKLDPATADAELKDGVLAISFATKPEAERRKIEIRNTTEAV